MSLSQIPPQRPTPRKTYTPTAREPKFYDLLPENLRSQTWKEFRENWGVISYLHSRKPFLAIFGFLAFVISLTVPGVAAESGSPLILEFITAMISTFLFALLCYAPYKIVAVLMTGIIANRKFGIQSYREARFYITTIKKYLKRNDPQPRKNIQLPIRSSQVESSEMVQEPAPALRNVNKPAPIVITETAVKEESFLTRAQRRKQEQSKPRFTPPALNLGLKKKSRNVVIIDTSRMTTSQLLGQVLELEKQLGL